MTGAELRAGLQSLFGEHWRPQASEWLGIDKSTITRQVTGVSPVYGPVEAAVKAALQVKLMRDKHAQHEAARRDRQKVAHDPGL